MGELGSQYDMEEHEDWDAASVGLAVEVDTVGIRPDGTPNRRISYSLFTHRFVYLPVYYLPAKGSLIHSTQPGGLGW
jgi:hypothetical protein